MAHGGTDFRPDSQDTTGQNEWWRKLGSGALKVAGAVGSLACGVNRLCAAAVGGISEAGAYAFAHAGKDSFSWGRLGTSTLAGAVGGLTFKSKWFGSLLSKSRLLGTKSRLFGNTSLKAKVPGFVNQGRSQWRMGWSVHKSSPYFRIAAPYRGKNVKTFKFDIFRGREFRN